MPTVSDPNDVTSHSLDLTGLTAGTNYRIRVRSTDPTTNTSQWSDWINFTTPSAPTGMYISDAELSSKPTTGTAWTNMLSAADAFNPATMIDYDDNNTPDSTHAMAAALVYARTGTTSYATKVRDAINTIANSPYVKTSGSITAWGRNIPSWVVAADIIKLATFDAAVEADWQSFLAAMPLEPYVGSGQDNLQHAAEQRPNNVGNQSRGAVLAIALYTGNTALVQLMADLHYSLVAGGSASYPSSGTYAGRSDFSWGSDVSWHANPTDPSTYLEINPLNAMRDGHVFDGIQPDDYRRNGVYDPQNFPGTVTTPYAWGGMGGLTSTTYLLDRAGYPAKSWGDDALKRALARLRYLFENHSALGWEWAPTGGGSGDTGWIVFLLNYMYPTANFPNPAATSHGRPFAWTDWTHA